MEKVLFVAYNFPPMAGPGVYRSWKFVSNLRENNYDPIVVTLREEDIKKAKFPMDYQLLENLPTDLEIERLKSFDTLWIFHFLSRFKVYRIFWYFLYPLLWERDVLWSFIHYFKIKQIVKKHNIKLIYTSSGPFSVLFLGLLLKRFCKVSWVADLRDPFTDAYAWSFPSKLHWYLARKVEKYLLGKCDHLIVNTKAVKELYVKRGIKKSVKISNIISGF